MEDKEEYKKPYDISEDKSFVMIRCVNPECRNIWYAQTPKDAFPVQCIKCGSQWVFRR